MWVIRRTFMLILILAAAAPALARETCSEDWICVKSSREDDRIIVRAQNLRPWPVTVSLRMVSRRIPSRYRRTTNRTIGGGSEVEILSFKSPRGAGDRELYFYFDWTVGQLEVDHDDDYLYRLPYASGQGYRVLQGFGSRFSHTGLENYTVDFDMRIGTEVYAARGGTVVMLEESNSRGCWDRGCGRYANYLVVMHDDGSTGEYYHLAKNGALAAVGERIERGQLIALSGNTGHTTMPHLHFGVYRADSWGRTQSIRFRFDSQDGVVRRPRSGRRYVAE